MAPPTRARRSAAPPRASSSRNAIASSRRAAELCPRLRTSRRTLQDSFRQVADTTPVHYLRSVRLNAVRRRLMSTRAADLGVAQAAADRGFGHLSHFAERYKALFGELPSQTLRGDARIAAR